MGEITSSDVAAKNARLLGRAEKYGLLKHLKITLQKGEEILDIEGNLSQFGKYLNLIFPVLLGGILLVFGTVLLFIGPAFAIIVYIMGGACLLSFPLWERSEFKTRFLLFVVTNKAIILLSKLTTGEINQARNPYARLDRMYFSRYSSKLVSLYWGNSDLITFPTQLATCMKPIIDSMQYRYAPIKEQADRIAKDAYISRESIVEQARNGHEVPAEKVLEVYNRLAQYRSSYRLNIALTVGTAILFVIIAALTLSGFGDSSAEFFAIGTFICVGFFAPFILGLIISIGKSTMQALQGVVAVPQKKIVVEQGGIRVYTQAGEKFVPFATDMMIGPHACLQNFWGEKKEDGIVIRRVSNLRDPTFLGPVQHYAPLYVDIMDKYIQWLASQNYFLDEGAIKERYLLHDPAKMRVVQMITSAESLPETPLPAMSPPESTDAQQFPEPMAIESLQGSLKYPLQEYKLFMKDGERVRFVHHTDTPELRKRSFRLLIGFCISIGLFIPYFLLIGNVLGSYDFFLIMVSLLVGVALMGVAIVTLINGALYQSLRKEEFVFTDHRLLYRKGTTRELVDFEDVKALQTVLAPKGKKVYNQITFYSSKPLPQGQGSGNVRIELRDIPFNHAVIQFLKHLNL